VRGLQCPGVAVTGCCDDHHLLLCWACRVPAPVDSTVVTVRELTQMHPKGRSEAVGRVFWVHLSQLTTMWVLPHGGYLSRGGYFSHGGYLSHGEHLARGEHLALGSAPM